MHSLYVDSTAGLVIGLLDPEFNWIEYKDMDEKKPSEVIHHEIYSLVEKYKLDLKTMNFVFSAGPGSYTGMRLGEGIAQVLAWDSKNVFSFRHFDVPELVGIKQGFWVTNAFKGQVFVYNWNIAEGRSDKELVESSNFQIVDSDLGYTLSKDVTAFAGLKSTRDLIHNFSKEIFSKVIQLKMREPPFYFRTLDEEFK
jgi:tRNA threonylcarbamoyladenosine biosynthesis protein TsaB